jgi:hypothetical protein
MQPGVKSSSKKAGVMISDNISLHASVNNSAFSSFFFSIFAWVLLHAWGVQLGAGLAPHAFAAFLGIGPAAVSLRRYRLYWATISIPPRPAERPAKVGFNISNAGWGLLLLAIGSIVGRLILAGWVLPLAIVSIGLTFVPWSKIPLCRRHFFTSCALIGGGVACTLVVAGNHAAHLLAFPIACWVFWGSALIGLLRKF